LHHAVAAVQVAATTLVDHRDHINEPIWRRLFDAPREAHLIDLTRNFIAALGDVLDVPPTALTQEDVSAIGREVDRVAERLETRIDALKDPTDARAFVSAIYALRSRFEEISVRQTKSN
jgi:hypothetical protein